ncbi:hypothetical protein BR93DRAFT_616929 [Coniochaeta sp. PMI_546]|nr:hypothetical protein BR93DRAFT_616929 [Coniochaeta sp. PMI_546]
MLRLKPSVISLTAGEVKDAETRRRFRRHLRRADAEKSLERKRVEQNRDLLPRRRSSSRLNSQAKDRPVPDAIHESDGVLSSSPAQSPVTPEQHAATASPLAISNGPSRHASDDEESKAAREQCSSVPRLLEMAPRGFPHTLSPASTQRRDLGHERTPGATCVVKSSFGVQSHIDCTSGMAGDFETSRSNEDPKSPTRVSTSPNLPPPFSQTPRRTTAEYNASTVRKVPAEQYRCSLRLTIT